ncbi:MAG: hypothetical protein LKE29_04045 [Acidaminococcaceae bacterium]|jgi:hypothetical protein|nr:hypothetical protein [Acidaminococcaceae bacterium]
MSKNIVLLFVSDVKYDSKTLQIRQSQFDNIDTQGNITITEQTNESAIKYLNNRLNCDTETNHKSDRQVESNSVSKIDKLFVFVSTKVGKKISSELDSPKLEGDPTHFEFFVERIKDCVSSPNDVVKCEYDENADEEKVLDMVANMAKTILQEPDIEKWRKQGETITLHADMSGGMRNASMMLVGLMRFLEFSGMKLGNVLYSNWSFQRKHNLVEKANRVYSFFDLVSGANEFVKYGNVEQLKKYFEQAKEEKNISQALDNLLMAMENFSMQIKLCYYFAFKEAVDNLRVAIDKFKVIAETSQNVNDKLFNVILPTVEQEYFAVLNKNATDLDYIKWCLSKGYLQQTLTLYVERIPLFVCDEEHLLTVSDNSEENFETNYAGYLKGGGNGGDRAFFLIKEYLPKVAGNKYYDSDMLKKLNGIVKKALDTQDALTFENEYNELVKKYAKYCQVSNEKTVYDTIKKQIELARDKTAKLNEYDLNFAKRLIDFCQENLKQEKFDKGNLDKVNYKQKIENLHSMYTMIEEGKTLINPWEFKKQYWFVMRQLPIKLYKKVFAIEIETKTETKTESKRLKRSILIDNLLNEKVLETPLKDRELLDEIIDDYIYLVEKRNDVNHARSEKKDDITVEIIEKRVNTAIERIEKAVKIVNA